MKGPSIILMHDSAAPAPNSPTAFACMAEDDYNPADEMVAEYWHAVQAETPDEAAEAFVEERTQGVWPEDGEKRVVRVRGHGAFNVWAHLSVNFSATAVQPGGRHG